MAYTDQDLLKLALPGWTAAVVTWLVDGSGEVSSYAGSSPGYSVAAVASATGRWTITLPRGAKDVMLVGYNVDQADSTALIHVSENQTEYVAGAATFEVRTKINAGTLTDPASGDRVKVVLLVNERAIVNRS